MPRGEPLSGRTFRNVADRPDLPAPIVTISDPAHPAPPRDVLGAEPRQLSPAAKRGVRLLVVIAVVAAAGVWGARYVVEQRRLDREAVSELNLGLAGSVGDPTVVQLISAGRHPVTVLSAGLDLPHLPLLSRTPTRLVPNAPTDLSVTAPSSCPASVAGAPSALVLRVRTYRGQERTVRLPLGDPENYLTNVVYQVLAGCGGYAPGDSFTRTSTTTEAVDGITVRVTVHNRAAVPRQLQLDEVTGGLFLAADAPGLVALGPGQSRDLELALSVEDCLEATSTWRPGAADGFAAAVTGGGRFVYLPYGEPAIVSWVRNYCSA